MDALGRTGSKPSVVRRNPVPPSAFRTAVTALIPLLLFALAGPAPAAAPAPGVDDLAPAFANTIVTTYPDGRSARLWLNRDGSWTSRGRRGHYSTGRWTLKGEKLCLKRQHPPAPFAWCTRQVPHGAVGTRWADKAPTGETVSMQLVAGRAELPAQVSTEQ
jgi:hypothetical protein